MLPFCSCCCVWAWVGCAGCWDGGGGAGSGCWGCGGLARVGITGNRKPQRLRERPLDPDAINTWHLSLPLKINCGYLPVNSVGTTHTLYPILNVLYLVPLLQGTEVIVITKLYWTYPLQIKVCLTMTKSRVIGLFLFTSFITVFRIHSRSTNHKISWYNRFKMCKI